MQLALKIEGDLQKRLTETIAKAPFHIKRAVAKATDRMLTESIHQAPHWKNELRSGQFAQRTREGFTGTVENRLKRAIFTHEGTSPHFPPIGAIAQWANEHGIPPFILARSIAKKGTKANPWMTRTFEKEHDSVIRIFEEAVEDIAKNT